MSEPWGCIIEVKITELALNNYLRCKQKNIEFPTSFYPELCQNVHGSLQSAPINKSKNITYFYASQLYNLKNRDSENDVIIFHYDEYKQRVFIAIIYDHDRFSIYSHTVLTLLAQLADYKDIDSKDITLFISPWSNDLYAAYLIEKGSFQKLDQPNFSTHIINEKIEQFFGFMGKKDFFPPIDVALRKKSYYYKPIRNAYRRYCKEQEEIEIPNKINQATRENPYPLFGYFYSFNNKVYEYRGNDYIELDGADPVTLREILMFDLCADKKHVYLGNLGRNYHCLEGIDGETFSKCGYGEATYWKDKNHVYIDKISKKQTLIKLDNVDVKTFKSNNGFGFGRDKNHVYMNGKILPLDVKSARLTINGFIFDDHCVYYYSHPVALDGQTFKVLHYESTTNPFIGPFIVADKTGLYRYDNKTGTKLLEKIRDLSLEEHAKIAQFSMLEINI